MNIKWIEDNKYILANKIFEKNKELVDKLFLKLSLLINGGRTFKYVRILVKGSGMSRYEGDGFTEKNENIIADNHKDALVLSYRYYRVWKNGVSEADTDPISEMIALNNFLHYTSCQLHQRGLVNNVILELLFESYAAKIVLFWCSLLITDYKHYITNNPIALPRIETIFNHGALFAMNVMSSAKCILKTAKILLGRIIDISYESFKALYSTEYNDVDNNECFDYLCELTNSRVTQIITQLIPANKVPRKFIRTYLHRNCYTDGILDFDALVPVDLYDEVMHYVKTPLQLKSKIFKGAKCTIIYLGYGFHYEYGYNKCLTDELLSNNLSSLSF